VAKYNLERFTGGRRSVELEDGSTKGATVGKNLFWSDGSVILEAELRAIAGPSNPTFAYTDWQLIANIPGPITELSTLAGTGFVFVSPTTDYSVIDTTSAVAGSVPQFDGLVWGMGTALTNPMTLEGDMIVGGPLGVPTAVPAGTIAYVWTSNGPGVAPSWQVSSGGDGSFGCTFDGAGSALTAGKQVRGTIPFDCTIDRVSLLGDVTGDAVVDIWVDGYATYPPNAGDSITGATPPTLVAADKSEDSTLTGWTVTLTKGDTVIFSLTSAATLTQLTCTLEVTKL
jgi:hypothetical protein